MLLFRGGIIYSVALVVVLLVSLHGFGGCWHSTDLGTKMLTRCE